MMNKTTQSCIPEPNTFTDSLPAFMNGQMPSAFAFDFDKYDDEWKSKKKKRRGQKRKKKEKTGAKILESTEKVPVKDLLLGAYHIGCLESENRMLRAMVQLAVAAKNGTLNEKVIEVGCQLIDHE